MDQLIKWDDIDRQIDVERDFRALGKMHLEMDLRERIARKAKQLEGNNAVANKCAKYRIRIEAAIGEEYRQAESEKGGRPSKNASTESTSFKQDIAAEVGKNRDTLSRYVAEAALVTESPALLEEYEATCNADEKEVSSAGFIKYARDKEIEAGKKATTDTPAMPSAKYRVIYADPPWKYNQEQHSTERQKTTLENHYPPMPTEDICALPISDLCEESAVMFLWTTSPKLYEAKQVIDAWGFVYKASMVWDKIKHNVGHYVSVRHELLLICTRGSCLPDVKELHDSVVSIERTEHSVKPAYFRELIDKMYPKGKRVELFARSAAEGWDRWGNESA